MKPIYMRIIEAFVTLSLASLATLETLFFYLDTKIMKPILTKLIIAALAAVAAVMVAGLFQFDVVDNVIVPAALYLQTKHQPDMETFVRKNDPTAVLIANTIKACGQTQEWNIRSLHKAEWVISYSSDWTVWRQLDHRSTTADLVAQCKARGFSANFPSLRGDSKATAVLVASTAEQLGVSWRLRHRTGGFIAHTWCEVEMNGSWYSLGAKIQAKSEFPKEAAPELPNPACPEIWPSKFTHGVLVGRDNSDFVANCVMSAYNQAAANDDAPDENRLRHLYELMDYIRLEQWIIGLEPPFTSINLDVNNTERIKNRPSS